MRRRVLLLGATTALALGLAACGGSARSFTAPLPTYAAIPQGPQLNPLTSWVFQAEMTPKGACASLGGSALSSVSFLWPSGYKVRFNPTELLGPNGHVVVREGGLLNFTSFPTTLPDRCRSPGQKVVGVEPLTRSGVPLPA
jgi:hypothetical protein